MIIKICNSQALVIKGVMTACILICSHVTLSQCPEQTSQNYDYCLKEISIEGSTNVNSFSFSYENPFFSDVMVVNDFCHHQEPETGLMDFSIPVQSFRGSIPAMRKDFLTLLKAWEYPEIIVGIEKNEFDCITSGIHKDRINLMY